MTKEMVQADLDRLPEGYKTAEVDRLIERYVREKQDMSALRAYVLAEQQLHRIYFHTSLKQIRDVNERMKWLDGNLLFSDWWHTDENIRFVSDLNLETALEYARRYVTDSDPFIRRWGYVMFISKLCRSEAALHGILPLLHNDEHYYVQMAQAWLIAELTVFFPDEIYEWLPQSGLNYTITGRAVQKICDSYRIDTRMKVLFRTLRESLKHTAPTHKNTIPDNRTLL